MVVILTREAISWLSRMQAVTSSGASEARHIALSETVEEFILFETGSAESHGTADEDFTCSIVRRGRRV